MVYRWVFVCLLKKIGGKGRNIIYYSGKNLLVKRKLEVYWFFFFIKVIVYYFICSKLICF